MSKLARLIVTLLVSALLLVVLLVVFERHNLAQTPTWRSTLDGYLGLKAAQGQPVTVLATRHAGQALTFSRDLRGGVYGDTSYYDPSYNSGSALTRGIPVPNTATDVWCVLVEPPQAAGSDLRRVLFVAYHEEIYQGRWIVTEGPAQPFSAAVAKSLDDMGCDLP